MKTQIESKKFKKAVADKILELEDFFHISHPNKIVRDALEACANASVWLLRHERLCEKVPPADPKYSYLFSQRDRADRRYKARFAVLQKLLGGKSNNHKQKHFGVGAYFGFYRIQGEDYIHWRYIISNPYAYGFHTRPPAERKKIRDEYFISVSAAEKLKQEFHTGLDDLSDDEVELQLTRAQEASKKRNYTQLDWSEWHRLFESGSKDSEPVHFNDAVPSTDVSEKSIRNAIDYRNRKNTSRQKTGERC